MQLSTWRQVVLIIFGRYVLHKFTKVGSTEPEQIFGLETRGSWEQFFF